MFKELMISSSFTSETADCVFPNVCGDRYVGDVSFIATLRALVSNRMSKDDTLYLRIKNRAIRSQAIKDGSVSDKLSALSIGGENNSICIYKLSSEDSEGCRLAMDFLDEYFVKTYPQFVELKDLRAFVAKNANMRFYINEDDRSILVFAENLNIRLYHYIQSLISRLLPWYFKDKPLNSDERELVKSLIQKTPDDYKRLIEEFAKKYDFREQKIKRMLDGFETAAKRNQLKCVERAIKNVEDDIEININQYKALLRKREEDMIRKDGLTAQIKAGIKDSEIMEYFICNRHLNPVNVCESELEFIVSCYLENFDLDMYERISNNFDSYMYGTYDVTNDVFKEATVRKKFFDAIFSDDPLLKIKTCAFYCCDLLGSVSTQRRYEFPSEYADMLPNAHLHVHSCLGNQKPLIEEALRRGDYIGAIEQCVCSAKSINIGESSTFPFVAKEIFSANAKKIIELPDGTSCTPTEALKWLEEQENKMEVSE